MKSKSLSQKETATTKDYGISSETMLTVEGLYRGPVTVFLRSWSKIREVYVDLDFKVLHVKKMIENMDAIPASKITLRFQGKKLHDENSLLESGIEDDSVIEYDWERGK